MVGSKAGMYEVIPQTLWPIANSLMERDGPKATTAVDGPLEITYHRNEKTNGIVGSLEKSSHLMMCVTKP
jgi:hypothetical protein